MIGRVAWLLVGRYLDLTIMEHQILTGIQSLARGFFHGFTGIVADPVADVMDDGAAGFAKGFVTGTLGVLFKPGAGNTHQIF